jgi:hypothetical protein
MDCYQITAASAAHEVGNGYKKIAEVRGYRLQLTLTSLEHIFCAGQEVRGRKVC